MKHCSSCGAELEENAVFCPRCGASCKEAAPVNLEKPDGSRTESQAGSQTDSRPYRAGTPYNTADPLGYPMKWHRFLMVVMLIGAVITIFNGFTSLTGYNYNTSEGLTAEMVYRAYPSLKAIDILYGVAVIALGVYQIFVRNQLNAFRVNGPRMLDWLYIGSLTVNIVYLALASNATKISLFNDSSLITLAGNAGMFIINHIYYSKRRDLFKY